jgi:radical SAM superfamily enzyme YgiQ (UPF0313 family)
MRVLLINSNQKDDILAAPPIGLCYVASATLAAGHEVRVLDLCFRRHIRKELVKAIADFSPEVIGISIRNLDNANMLYPVYYLTQVGEIIRYIKEITRVPVVLGGSGVSLSPGGVLTLLGADYMIVLDGEESFVQLLAALKAGEEPDRIPGVGLVRQGKFHLTPPELHRFPGHNPNLGRWIDLQPYRKMGASYNVQTKRGCRQRCIYCVYPNLEGNTLRLRSPVEVVDELEEAFNRFQPETFEFVDSMFNDPTAYAGEILEEILRRPWKASFTAMGVSPRNLDDAFLKLMWQAGFTSFSISPESAAPTMISNYQKGFTGDEVIHAAEAINRTGFTVFWNFLIGGPGETNETLQESLDFALKYLNAQKRPTYHIANFFLGLRLYPGTKLWDTALEEGLIKEDSDPLKQLWYLSPELDTDLALEQMTRAAFKCSEISLGFDEKYLSVSKIVGFMGWLFGMPKPYWRHMWGLNQILLKLGLRSFGRRLEVGAKIRGYLKRQGYPPALRDGSSGVPPAGDAR